MTDSPRLGVHRPVGADDYTIVADLQDIVDTLDDAAIDQQGTLAARPAANAVPQGTYYFATDGLKLYRSDGATWQYVIPDGSVTSAQLANDSVNGAKLAGSSVVSSHLGKQSVGSLSTGVIQATTTNVAATGAGTLILETNASYVDVVAATSRIRAAQTGLYSFSFFVSFAAHDAQQVVSTIWKNGASIDVGGAISGVQEYGCMFSRTLVLSLAADDYIQIGGYVVDGSPIPADPDLVGVITAVYLGRAS